MGKGLGSGENAGDPQREGPLDLTVALTLSLSHCCAVGWVAHPTHQHCLLEVQFSCSNTSDGSPLPGE